jgi:hypothetical protein
MQGMPQRVANDLEAVQGPHRRQNMGGVYPLPTPRLDELTVATPDEQHVEEQGLGRPSDQSGATFTEERGIEPGIRELQA